MKLYEIQSEIVNLFITDDNGEILEDAYARFVELKGEEEKKLENACLYYKNLLAEAKAIKDEVDNLSKRQKVKENKGESIKKFLDNYLRLTQKDNFETPKCKVTFRKSTGVVITDENALIDEFKKTEYKVLTKEIADALKAHREVTGAMLEERNNIQIK